MIRDQFESLDLAVSLPPIEAASLEQGPPVPHAKISKTGRQHTEN